MKIAELEERCRKLSEAISDPQAAFLAYLQDNKPTEEKKGRGRPRIDGKRFELKLDLDLSIIVEEAAKIQRRSVARLINEATRRYLASEFEDLFLRLSQPRGKEYEPIEPLNPIYDV